MPHPDESKLLSSLPRPIRTPLAQALAKAPPSIGAGFDGNGTTYGDAWDGAIDACEAAGFPSDGLPLASELTPDQRAVATILAYRDEFAKYIQYLPSHGYWRRRWLGFEAPGVLEREVVVGGVRQPLWKAIESDEDDEVLLTSGLSLCERLDAIWGIWCDAYMLRFSYQDLAWGRLSEIEGQPEIAAWAKQSIESVVAARAAGHRDYVWNGADRKWAQPVFYALCTAKIPIAEEWDRYLPVIDGPPSGAVIAIFKGLPEERRAAAIIGALSKFGLQHIRRGLEMLAHFPSRELAAHLVAEVPKTDFKPSLFRQEMAAIAKKHPVVAEVLAVASTQGAALVIARTRRPTSVDDLSPLERKQLEHAGKGYDGKQLSAAIRLSDAREHEEETFRGSLEIRDVTDAKGKPAFAVLLYRDDSGSIFRAGTTREVADVVQDSLQCDDTALRASLLEVVGALPKRMRAATATKAAERKSAATKKPRAKKLVAKKSASKKPATKSGTKKLVTKKSTSKKR